MELDSDFIEKVRVANNIVDIIGQYTELKLRGQNYMGLCPFPGHNEKTPSFSVSEAKQLYHCFGCKKSGNIFSFLKDYNGFSFMEALEHLALRVNLSLPKKQNSSTRKPFSRDQKQQMFKINRVAMDFYHQKLKNLPKGHKLHSYLEKRQLTDELVREFSIGYAPESWDELSTHFNRNKTDLVLVEKLGLVRKNKKGNYFDLFRDRLMFPIFSIQGHVTGFGGRVIDRGEIKYINSQESEIFKKGQGFYGLNRSLGMIRSEDQVFVVEGYMDFLALYSKGVKNVVASLGTALTQRQVRLLKRWTNNIVLLFDGDSAGQMAAKKSLVQFFKENVSPKTLLLPENMDPYDFIHNFGKEVFLKKALSAEDLFLKMWLNDYRGDPANKIQFLNEISPLLNSLKDKRLLEIYIQQMAPHLAETPKKLFSWLKQKRNTKSFSDPQKKDSTEDQREPSEELPSKICLEKAKEDELSLLALCFKFSKYMDFCVDQGMEKFLTHKALKELFSQLVNRYRQEPKNFDNLVSWFFLKIENPEKITNLVNLLPESGREKEEEAFLKKCVVSVKDRYLQHQGAILVGEMKIEPSRKNMEQFVKIQSDRKALKNIKNLPLEKTF